MKRLSLMTALVLATLGSPVWAQAQADPPAGPPAAGRGMMMGGAQSMMGGNLPMMMQMMAARQAGVGMGGMATIDRVEGRIAFLRTELKITDAQTSAWNAFADALRSNAKGLGEVRAAMIQGVAPQGLIDRLALQEKWLAARLDGTRAIKAALITLVGTLSDEQKKTADELLAPHMGMGMMAMTAGMQPGQMMQPGIGMMTQGQGR